MAVNVYAALAGFLLFLALPKYHHHLNLRLGNVSYFAIAGFVDSIALVALFGVLDLRPVSVVVPFSGIGPLFVPIRA